MDSRAALAGFIEESSALGLRAGTVHMSDPNPVWSQVYDKFHAHLMQHLADVACTIEHVGSTSVPGLAAKPILDIAIGAATPDPTVFTDRLSDAGFVFKADLGIYGGLFYTFELQSNTTVAHLHVVDIDEFQWQWYLAFRDGLRANPDLVTEYADLKHQAAQAHSTDRDGYTKAKFDWVLATVSSLTTDNPAQANESK